MVKVYYKLIPAKLILNLTSPRHLGPIIRDWNGKYSWFASRYEPLRDLIEKMYVDGFNKANGHYFRLEKDIIDRGVRDPVMLVTGGPRRLPLCQVPPEYRDKPNVLMSEYLGGSRIYIAQKHGLIVPTLINDYANCITGGMQIMVREEIISLFEKPPRQVQFSSRAGVYVNDMPYTHMPNGYSISNQSRVRAEIIDRIRVEVKRWLRENDND